MFTQKKSSMDVLNENVLPNMKWRSKKTTHLKASKKITKLQTQKQSNSILSTIKQNEEKCACIQD